MFHSKKVIYLKYISYYVEFKSINIFTDILYRSRLTDIKIIIRVYLEYYLCTMHIS